MWFTVSVAATNLNLVDELVELTHLALTTLPTITTLLGALAAGINLGVAILNARLARRHGNWP